MPTDFSDRPDPNDSPMFAPIPSWERNKKRGMFGRSARPAARPDATVAETIAEEPRSFAPESAAAPTAAAGMGVGAMDSTRMDTERMDYVDPTETTFAGTPAYATRTTTRRSGAAPLAIAGGIILVGGLAAAGWYATQPHSQGVAELTPGAPVTTTTTTDTTAAAAPAAAPPIAHSQMAANTPPPMPEPARAAPARTSSRTTVTHHTASVRAGRSAQEAGVNAAATIPARPQTYAPSAQAPAPAPAPAPTLTPAPTQAAPAPAPTPPVDTPPTINPPSPGPTPQ